MLLLYIYITNDCMQRQKDPHLCSDEEKINLLKI